MRPEPKEFQELIYCWQSLPRQAGKAPRKRHFSPARVPRLLPHVYLIERSRPNNICIRLMGSELESVFGALTPRGNVFNTLLSDEWNYYDRIYTECAKNICAGRISRCVTVGQGLAFEVESLCVPLSDDMGDPKFILGVMVMKKSRELNIQIMKNASPRNQILNQKFIDLGVGVPSDVPPPPALEYAVLL